MEEEDEGFVSKFGITDFCVLGAMLVISMAIGIYTSYIGNKSPEEFLMGNRSFKPFPIAMSLLTSYVSAISLLGYSGEVYAHGSQICLFVVGVCLGIIFAGYSILPVIFPLQLTSINEYIELRFKSKRLRTCVTLVTCVHSFFFMGVCLYAPTIALVSVTNLDYLTYIFLLGIICTIYSSFGGIRAVIWTDVFQLSVMLLGLVVIVIVGIRQNGGLIKTWFIASENGRMEFFDMNPGIYERHTFFNTIGYGVFVYAYLFGVAQINVQRMCSVRRIEDAYKILVINGFGMILIYFLIFTGGIIAYVAYVACDPMVLGLIEKKEEIMPHYITDRLSFIPGLPGMFVATLVGGTLSSLSSVINATVAMVWRDFCLKFTIFKNSSTRCSTLTNKVLSLLIGIILIGMALLTSKAKNLIQFVTTISGVIKGPVFGVFLIGFFFPRCNIKGVWTGFIFSSVFVSWISLGGLYLKEPPKFLSFSIDECDDADITRFNHSESEGFDSVFNGTNNAAQSRASQYEHPLAPLYLISYTLYGVIGPILCIAVAVIVSFLTGNQSIEEVSPKYVTPYVRRFYWSKDDLETIYEKENKLTSNGIKSNPLDHPENEFFLANMPKKDIS